MLGFFKNNHTKNFYSYCILLENKSILKRCYKRNPDRKSKATEMLSGVTEQHETPPPVMTAASTELRMKTEALVNTVNRQVSSEEMLAWAQLSTHYPLMTIMETNELVLFTAAVIPQIFGYKIKNAARRVSFI